MRDFYTEQGYWVYNPTTKDFTTVFNEQVVLQRLTNLLSIQGTQWLIDPTLYIDYVTLMSDGNLNEITDTIRNKILADPNFGGFVSFVTSFANNTLNVNLVILINGNQYTLMIEQTL